MILLVILFNWFIIFVMLNLFIPSPLQGLSGSLLVMAFLIGLAHTPFMENFLRWTSGLRPGLLEERLKVDSIVQDLSKRACLKTTPDIYIADYSFPNAYAIGKHTIGITKGLLDTATKEELYGVLAHEVGHLKHGDSMRYVIARISNTSGILASWAILHAVRFQSYHILPEPSGLFSATFAVSTAVICLLIGVIRWYFGVSFRVVGHKEEYKADSFVVQVGGGGGFISFLNTTKRFEFSQRSGFWEKVAATHPPVLRRIERMRKRMDEMKTHSPV